MKHLINTRAIACVIALAALLVPIAALAQNDLPELTAPVNDFAGVLDAASRSELDALIRKVQAATGDVIVVATVKTFKPYPDMASYAVKLFENHGKGIGIKGKDNGVLILLALEDRQVRIEPGYGLEGFITDGFSGETSRQMVPFFRDGNYGAGLVNGATRVAQRIAEERNVSIDVGQPAQRTAERGNRGGGIPFGFWVILAIIILNMMGRGGRRRRRWYSGVGPFGGGFGGGYRGGFGGGGFGGGGFGGFGGGRSGGGGGGAGW